MPGKHLATRLLCQALMEHLTVHLLPLIFSTNSIKAINKIDALFQLTSEIELMIKTRKYSTEDQY